MLCSGMGTRFSESELGSRVKVCVLFLLQWKALFTLIVQWWWQWSMLLYCECSVADCVCCWQGWSMSWVSETSRVQVAQPHDSMGASDGEKEQQGVSCCCILVCKIVYNKKGQRSPGTFKILTWGGPHPYLGTRISFRHLFIFLFKQSQQYLSTMIENIKAKQIHIYQLECIIHMEKHCQANSNIVVARFAWPCTTFLQKKKIVKSSAHCFIRSMIKLEILCQQLVKKQVHFSIL